MRTDRVYRQALSYEVALAELRTNTGTQFDPQVAAAVIVVVAAERAIDPPDALPGRTLEGSDERDLRGLPRLQAPLRS
jgi:hypothetical protein